MNSVSKNKKEKITIEKLAQITIRGFLEVNKKIDKLEVRMDNMEAKMDKLEVRMDNMEAKMDKLEVRMDNMEGQMKRSTELIIDARITMDRRLNSMEEKMEKNADKILIAADSMTKQFSHWNEENAFSAGIESRQDDELKNHEKRIIKIEQKLEV